MLSSLRFRFALVVLILGLGACANPPAPATQIPATMAPINTDVLPTDTPLAEAPTATIAPTTAPTVAPLPTIIQYPIPQKPFNKIPTIVISSAPNDPRIALVYKAVDYWNQQFKQIGTPFHLGTVIQATNQLPDQDLIILGKDETDSSAQQGLVSLVNAMPGDFVIALSQASFISFGKPVGTKRLIGIQGHPGGANSSPIVIQNVIAHELGHLIGLGHNNDPAMLMCGRPAPCRPGGDQYVNIQGFAPLTEAEKAYLLKIYPPTWKPGP